MSAWTGGHAEIHPQFVWVSETVDSLPVHIRRNPDGTRERDTSHPASTILAAAANPWTGAAELRIQLQTDALLHTRGDFAAVVRANAQVRELHRLS
jgi:phage portal protein BeeE